MRGQRNESALLYGARQQLSRNKAPVSVMIEKERKAKMAFLKENRLALISLTLDYLKEQLEEDWKADFKEKWPKIDCRVVEFIQLKEDILIGEATLVGKKADLADYDRSIINSPATVPLQFSDSDFLLERDYHKLLVKERPDLVEEARRYFEG
jgi:hypothetical protein